MSPFQAVVRWWRGQASRTPLEQGTSTAVKAPVPVEHTHEQWRYRLENAGMFGWLDEFRAAPEHVVRQVAMDDHQRLDGPEVFGQRLVRWHPLVLLHFVELGLWQTRDLGKFIDQTCHFGMEFFVAGGGALKNDVLPETICSWCTTVLSRFELTDAQRERFVGHVATGLSDELWLAHGYPACAPYTAGIDMDVLIAVARRTRPQEVPLEIDAVLDAGLRNVQGPVVNIYQERAQVGAPYSGVCPELDLLLSVEKPLLTEELYRIGVRLKRIQRGTLEMYELPPDVV